MTTRTDVKTQDFSEPEARRLAIRAVLKGDLSPEGSVVMLAAVTEAQEEEITQLSAALGYANETLRLFKEFRALVCKAAWALAMPGSEAANMTGFAGSERELRQENFKGHAHGVFTEEQRQGLAALAAVDTSGYAPVSGGSAAEGCLMRPGGPVKRPGEGLPRLRKAMPA
ncbi:MAG: hypothetical protein MUP14_03870 [Dehalococcoidia bacterium]|nr:hypothetical protein [Dehalococcoidia bacterium]